MGALRRGRGATRIGVVEQAELFLEAQEGLEHHQHPQRGGVVAGAALVLVHQALQASGLHPLRATRIDILQINVGRRCNQTCRHCHVDAGPDRAEMMPDAVMDRCLEIIESTDIPTVDITGGAPELHRRWRELVVPARPAGNHRHHWRSRHKQ